MTVENDQVRAFFRIVPQKLAFSSKRGRFRAKCYEIKVVIEKQILCSRESDINLLQDLGKIVTAFYTRDSAITFKTYCFSKYYYIFSLRNDQLQLLNSTPVTISHYDDNGTTILIKMKVYIYFSRYGLFRIQKLVKLSLPLF